MGSVITAEDSGRASEGLSTPGYLVYYSSRQRRRAVRLFFWCDGAVGCCYFMTKLPSVRVRDKGDIPTVARLYSRLARLLSPNSEGLLGILHVDCSGDGLLTLLSGHSTRVGPLTAVAGRR